MNMYQGRKENVLVRSRFHAWQVIGSIPKFSDSGILMNIRGLWSVYTNLINEAEMTTEEIVHTLPLLSFEISTGKS